MEYKEFMDLVKYGVEHNFYIEDEEYWISRNADGYYVTRVRDSFTQAFVTSEKLFESAQINGKTILELWNTIQEYC